MGKGSTETRTQSLSREDANAIRQGRQAGQATAGAAMGIQEAGVNPLVEQAISQFGNQYGQYGDLYGFGTGLGQQALGFAGQTGLAGLDQYMNPMIGAQLAGLDPLYAQQLDFARNQANQQATQAGAFGGSRHGIAQAQLQGDVLRNQAAQYGNIYGQSARDAASMLMGERGRMQGLGQYGMGLGLNALQGQGQIAGQNASMGDYLRNIQQLMNERGFKNAMLAQQGIQSGYGKDIKTTDTTEKSGNLFNDIMGLGGMAASFLVPGAGPALSMAGMFNGYGSPSIQDFGSQFGPGGASSWADVSRLGPMQPGYGPSLGALAPSSGPRLGPLGG